MATTKEPPAPPIDDPDSIDNLCPVPDDEKILMSPDVFEKSTVSRILNLSFNLHEKLLVDPLTYFMVNYLDLCVG